MPGDGLPLEERHMGHASNLTGSEIETGSASGEIEFAGPGDEQGSDLTPCPLLFRSS